MLLLWLLVTTADAHASSWLWGGGPSCESRIHPDKCLQNTQICAWCVPTQTCMGYDPCNNATQHLCPHHDFVPSTLGCDVVVRDKFHVAWMALLSGWCGQVAAMIWFDRDLRKRRHPRGWDRNLVWGMMKLCECLAVLNMVLLGLLPLSVFENPDHLITWSLFNVMSIVFVTALRFAMTDCRC